VQIVITGASGTLGVSLARRLGSSAVPLHRSELDVASSTSVGRLLSRIKPETVVNCGAYTLVDQAEVEPDKCMACNAAGATNLAEYCANAGILFVQISTDYVFGGEAERKSPYAEGDQPAPLSVYGRSKLAAEESARTVPRHLVVRTCGLWGSTHRPDFVKTILGRAKSGETLRVVADQCCSPTYVVDAADGIIGLIEAHCEGVFHVVNDAAITWYEFACEILKMSGLQARVVPVSSLEYGSLAPRPRYSVLNCDKYLKATGRRMRGYRAALAEVQSSGRLRANLDAQ
jgi:dTDP-4-dehydrorhamnose reductase